MNWTESDVITYLKRFTDKGRKAQAQIDATLRAANLEPTKRPRPKGPDARQEVHPRYRISVHQKRRRRTDPDGISAKAAIDGLVLGGLLPDDSADWVSEVTFSQEKNKVEQTVIEVWEIEK